VSLITKDMSDDIDQRIELSVALLDEYSHLLPDDWRGVVVKQRKRLRMSSGCDCMLGILFDPESLYDEDDPADDSESGYDRGMDKMELYGDDFDDENEYAFFSWTGLSRAIMAEIEGVDRWYHRTSRNLSWEYLEAGWNKQIDIWETELTEKGQIDEPIW